MLNLSQPKTKSTRILPGFSLVLLLSLVHVFRTSSAAPSQSQSHSSQSNSLPQLELLISKPRPTVTAATGAGAASSPQLLIAKPLYDFRPTSKPTIENQGGIIIPEMDGLGMEYNDFMGHVNTMLSSMTYNLVTMPLHLGRALTLAWRGQNMFRSQMKETLTPMYSKITNFYSNNGPWANNKRKRQPYNYRRQPPPDSEFLDAYGA